MCQVYIKVSSVLGVYKDIQCVRCIIKHNSIQVTAVQGT